MNKQYLLLVIICITLLVFGILYSFGISRSNAETPCAETPLGRINGYYKTSFHGRQYAAYEGIPYAQPPIGELRFQPPVPITKYPRDINATKLPVICLQYNSLVPRISSIEGKENCLFLNIYTPMTNNQKLLPVIFWIHGGGFQIGTSSNYRAKYLMDRDVILVTFNYRVGPFGFLSTGDGVVPGNMGLKDQHLALKWVSDNIRYFNGDRSRITLMGVSAGGASVHYHYLSPKNAGLFQNGVSFSGTALGRWAYINDSTELTKSLAISTNCSINTSKDMIQCLKNVSAMDITKAHRTMLKGLFFPYPTFRPTAEKSSKNYFINDSPLNILESGKSNDVPWITGGVSEEGLVMVAGFALNDTTMAYLNENWEKFAPFFFTYIETEPKSKHAQLAKLIKKHYFGDRPISTNRKTIKDFIHSIGDNLITANGIRAVKLQASVHKSPVYYYYYTYRAAQSITNKSANTTENFGVSHDDDIYLVLENKYIDPTTTESDRAMLQDMLNFWESVAKDGKPDLGTEWPKFNPLEEFKYMHIAGPGNFTMQTDNNLCEISFWDSIGL